jgi:hypothetical protein
MQHHLTLVLLFALIILVSCGSGSGGSSFTVDLPPGNQDFPPGNQFVPGFMSPDTDAHQGYATDGTFHFLFDTGRVIKRANDATWSLLAENDLVFANLSGYNHLGDGTYYQGQLYVVGEYYLECSNHSKPSIFVFDANSLARESATQLPDQQEVSGMTIDPSAKEIWVSSFCDGSRIWVYDLATMMLKRTVDLQPNVAHIQGIAIGPDAFYLSQHEGKIWRMTRAGACTQVYQSSISGVAHEGLDYSQQELRWLIDSDVGHKNIYYLLPK